jgi:hypothetical protein
MRVHLKSLSKRWQRKHSTSFGSGGGRRLSLGGNSIRTSLMLFSGMDGGGTADAERLRLENLEDLVGTALVLAYLQVTQLMPALELAQCCSLAAKHFEHCRTPSGWGFTHLRITFLTLISPGILNVKSSWLVRARIWKLILGQNTEGYWDANQSSAFALEARPPEEMARLTPTLITRVSDFFRGAAQALGDEGEQTGGHVLTEAIASSRASVAGTTFKESDMREMRSSSSVCGVNEPASATVFDCPLTNSPASILATVPRVLLACEADDASINVARVWATMCCISLLERQRIAWLWVRGLLAALRCASAPRAFMC